MKRSLTNEQIVHAARELLHDQWESMFKNLLLIATSEINDAASAKSAVRAATLILSYVESGKYLEYKPIKGERN